MFNRTRRIEAENERLSAENGRLHTENARLTREVELLRDRLFTPAFPEVPQFGQKYPPTITSDRTEPSVTYDDHYVYRGTIWGGEDITQTISTPVDNWTASQVAVALRGGSVEIDNVPRGA